MNGPDLAVWLLACIAESEIEAGVVLGVADDELRYLSGGAAVERLAKQTLTTCEAHRRIVGRYRRLLSAKIPDPLLVGEYETVILPALATIHADQGEALGDDRPDP